MPTGPDFPRIVKLDEDSLAAKLELVREALTHPGEKGRSLEAATSALIRDMLPEEYGLSTGFIAYHGPQGKPVLSTQLDIIIYDAMRSGPLLSLGGCDVFPIEAVYGYVEVKASVGATGKLAKPKLTTLESCIQTNAFLNSIIERRFWTPVKGSNTKVKVERLEWLNIRSYLVAFEARGSISDVSSFAKRMSALCQHYGEESHFHGVLIPNRAFFRTRPIDHKDKGRLHTVDYVTQSALAAFRHELLTGLNRFPRIPLYWSPAIDQYFGTPSYTQVEPDPSVLSAVIAADDDRDAEEH